MDLADDELIEIATRELGGMLGISAPPALARVDRWRNAGAQHNVGQLARIAALEERLAGLPGVFVAGSGFRSVGIPDCVATAARRRRAAAQHVRQDGRDGYERMHLRSHSAIAARHGDSIDADVSRDSHPSASHGLPDQARWQPPMARRRPKSRSCWREIKAQDKGQLAVSEEDGRFLRLMVASSGAKHALEIGGASGYSAIWIGMGLRDTGGTARDDRIRSRRARRSSRRTSSAPASSDIVQVVAGDAFQQIPKVPGTFDFVFLDAWKKDYKRFFDMVYPRLDKGGLFLAHNVVNKRSEMGDFLDAIQKHPSLWTTIVSPSGEGMSVSLKR